MNSVERDASIGGRPRTPRPVIGRGQVTCGQVLTYLPASERDDYRYTVFTSGSSERPTEKPKTKTERRLSAVTSKQKKEEKRS